MSLALGVIIYTLNSYIAIVFVVLSYFYIYFFLCLWWYYISNKEEIGWVIFSLEAVYIRNLTYFLTYQIPIIHTSYFIGQDYLFLVFVYSRMTRKIILNDYVMGTTKMETGAQIIQVVSVKADFL